MRDKGLPFEEMRKVRRTLGVRGRIPVLEVAIAVGLAVILSAVSMIH